LPLGLKNRRAAPVEAVGKPIRLNRSDATCWRIAFEFLEFVVKRGWLKDRAFFELLGRLDPTVEDIGLG
jgi:hypothetical protein